jgi:hypothetical protein
LSRHAPDGDDILVVADDPVEPDGVFYADITGDEAGDRETLRLEELPDARCSASITWASAGHRGSRRAAQ